MFNILYHKCLDDKLFIKILFIIETEKIIKIFFYIIKKIFS